MSRYVIRCFFVMACLSFANNIYAYTQADLWLPELKTMPGMKYEWVANPIIYNGNLLSIRNFFTRKNTRDVVNYYASLFKVKGHGELKSTMSGNVNAIGYENNGYLYSLQVKETKKGSEGSIVVSRIKRIKNIDPDFPMRSGDRLLMHIISFDGGRVTETLILDSMHSISMNKKWYKNKLGTTGWKHYFERSKNITYVEQYQKRRQYCQIIYSKDNLLNPHKSLIQIHWIKG